MGREESCPNPAVRLVADIGGTDARIALRSEDHRPPQILSLPCADYPEVAMLGGVAGNLALTVGARGGVFVGGGIVPRLGDFFLRSRFRDRFESKGRFANYLAPIPCFVIRAPYPGLLGSSRALEPALTRTP